MRSKPRHCGHSTNNMADAAHCIGLSALCCSIAVRKDPCTCLQIGSDGLGGSFAAADDAWRIVVGDDFLAVFSAIMIPT